MNFLRRAWKRSRGWSRVFVLGCAALTGCNRDEVKVYVVAKERDVVPPMPAQAAMPGAMPAGHPDTGGAALPRLTWTLPSGWEQQAPGEMRVASFSIQGSNGKQADVSVVPLPGMAGGDFPNVNRWRGQVGLPPAPEAELQAQAQGVEVGGQPAQFYDQAGKNPSSGEPARILAVIQHREGTAWFFKMTGDDEIVAQQKPAFVEFLKALRFEASGTPALPPSHPPIDGASLPAGHPDISMRPAPLAAAAASQAGRPDWQVPAGWQEASAGQFLVAKFIVTGEGGAQAAVNVSASTGDGGGLAANVNRWRKQLGLGELTSDEISRSVTTVDSAAGKATLVEISGTDAKTGQPAKLAAAIVPQGGRTWFYKLMGDAKVVEGQQDIFMKFVQAAKY